MVSAHIGYNRLEEDGGFLSSGEDNYTNFSIGISKEIGGIELALSYVGTDLDEEDVFDTTWGDPTAVFSLSKSL